MSGYIGSTPVPQATQHRESFTATEGQTSFATAGYTPQFVDVYLNGSHLSPADFVATNGSDVVLVVAASADDVCDIISYSPFEVAGATFTGTTTMDVAAITGVLTTTAATVSNGGGQFNGAINVGVDDTGHDVKFFGDAASAYMQWDASTDDLILGGASTLGIGTVSPLRQLHISNTSANSEIAFTAGTSGTSSLLFGDGLTGSDVYRGYIQYQHNGDYMLLATSATVRARFDADGLKFNADTAAANALNDYEEGTFTPALTDNSGRAGTGATQVGIYVKVGDLVHIQGRVSISSLASMNGVVNLTGMPFTSNSTSNSHASLNFGQASGLNISAGVSLCGIFSTNSTACEVQAFDVTTGSTGLTHTELSADGNMIFSGTYRSA